jgi:CBS domain-containing protein
MEKLSAILDKKPTHFYKISPACSVEEALSQMITQDTPWLAVMNEHESLLGIITEHDIARKTLLSGKSISAMRVKEIMSTRFPFADAEDSIEHAMHLMKHFHVHCLPVFKEIKFRGIISTEDILEEALDQKAAIF